MPLLATIFLFAQTMGHAAVPSTIYMTGEELIKSCRSVTALDPEGKGDPLDLMLCNGYIAGVVDGATASSGNTPNPLFRVCVPNAVSREQLVRVVLKYGQSHPERLHYPGVRLVFEALKEGFPCSE